MATVPMGLSPSCVTAWRSSPGPQQSVFSPRALMPLPFLDKDGQLFNNADSFAMAFDQAWKRHDQQQPGHGLSADEKLERILAVCADHPFLQSDPAMARQVAAFRVRLLGF